MQLHSETQVGFAKARQSEHQALDKLLTTVENRIRVAFVAFVRNVRSPEVRGLIRELLADNNLQGATNVVIDHITALGRVLPQAFVDVASKETASLADKAGFITKAKTPVYQGSISVEFDPSDPAAARLMQSSQLKFVQQVTDTQRAAIRSSLANAINTGDYDQSFIDAIGLTQSQVEAVSNYQNFLENGSSEALARDLRNRRYDRKVQAAIDSGEPLDADQIDTMVNAYRNNMLNMRADTIARTEGLSVMNQARQAAADQVVGQAGFDRKDVRRTWNAVKDDRTRDSHREMDGQEVGLDEPFETPDGEELQYPGDPDASAKERINCRCTVTLEFA